MVIRSELTDELFKGHTSPEDMLGEGGLFKQLAKAMEGCLQAELDTHRAYKKHPFKGKATSNLCNGRSRKIVKGKYGEIEIPVPFHHNCCYEPQILEKSQARLARFDDKILALYAQDMTDICLAVTQDQQAQSQEMYAAEVSRALISNSYYAKISSLELNAIGLRLWRQLKLKSEANQR